MPCFSAPLSRCRRVTPASDDPCCAAIRRCCSSRASSAPASAVRLHLPGPGPFPPSRRRSRSPRRDRFEPRSGSLSRRVKEKPIAAGRRACSRSPAAPLVANMVARASRSSAAPEKAALTSWSRSRAVPLSAIGSAASCSQWAGNASGKLVKPTIRTPANSSTIRRLPIALHRRRPGGFSGGTKRPFLKAAAVAAGRRSAGALRFGPTQRIEAVEPFLAIEPAEVGVADRRGVGDQALLEAGPGFGGGRGARPRARGATGGRRAARGFRATPRTPRGRRH